MQSANISVGSNITQQDFRRRLKYSIIEMSSRLNQQTMNNKNHHQSIVVLVSTQHTDTGAYLMQAPITSSFFAKAADLLIVRDGRLKMVGMKVLAGCDMLQLHGVTAAHCRAHLAYPLSMCLLHSPQALLIVLGTMSSHRVLPASAPIGDSMRVQIVILHRT